MIRDLKGRPGQSRTTGEGSHRVQKTRYSSSYSERKIKARKREARHCKTSHGCHERADEDF